MSQKIVVLEILESFDENAYCVSVSFQFFSYFHEPILNFKKIVKKIFLVSKNKQETFEHKKSNKNTAGFELTFEKRFVK